MDDHKKANNNKGIITIAIGEKYARQAKYLAWSCMLHTPWVTRAVITDRPEFLSPYYDIIISYKKEYGQPFSLKTQLYKYSPFFETAYIDADSLVINNFDYLWRFLEYRSFVYEGKTYTDGIWYFDIAQTIKQMDILWIPKFNSGMILFKKDDIAQSIFDTAYGMMINNKDIPVDFFRGQMLPDEPFLAIALAKKNEIPINSNEEYGRFSHTLIGAEHIRINAVKGFAGFVKNGRPVFPLVVHFCGKFGQIFYIREKLRLFFCFNPPLTTCFAALFSLIRNIRKKAFGKTKTAL
jgi:hypothetical protein